MNDVSMTVETTACVVPQAGGAVGTGLDGIDVADGMPVVTGAVPDGDMAVDINVVVSTPLFVSTASTSARVGDASISFPSPVVRTCTARGGPMEPVVMPSAAL